MSWITAALLSTLFFALISVFDKKLLTDLFRTVSDFFVVFGLMQIVIGTAFTIVALATDGIPVNPGFWWSIASGLAFAAGLPLFFTALRHEEASRAVPVMALMPVFATMIGVALLGERLTTVQSIAVIVIISGAALLSLRREKGALRIATGRAFLFLVAASAILGAAFVVIKLATETTSIWAVQGISTIVLGIAILTLIIALEAGPVSLVSVITATRPLLVLLLTIALSTPAWNILREPLDRETIGLKTISTALIVGGVITLAL